MFIGEVLDESATVREPPDKYFPRLTPRVWQAQRWRVVVLAAAYVVTVVDVEMALPAPVALSIFASYFGIIVALFWLIISSLPRRIPQNVSRTRVYMFIELTLASFAHTWYYMFAFMKRSFVDYELSARAANRTLPISTRITIWLSHTALFEQAWAAVCRTPANWWWSEQLCLFTVGAWTVMLYTYGPSHRIKYVWAYMLLGQVVAISVASNLFYLALLLHPPPRPTKPQPLPWTVHLPVFLSLWTVSRVPASLAHAPPYFLENLLTMHALLFLPFLPNRTLHRLLPPSSFLSLPPRTVYILIHLTSLVLRARTVFVFAGTVPPPRTFASVAGVLWGALQAHPAQASIGWDVVWTTLSFVAWSGRAPRARGVFIPFAAGTAIASVGVVAPAVLVLYA